MIVTKKVGSFDPLNVAAKIADGSLWAWERLDADELVIDIPGQWSDYRFHLFWQAQSGLLCLACFLDLKVPDPRPIAIYELLALVNRRLWIGHFDLVDDQWVGFRYGLPLMHDRFKNKDMVLQIEGLIDTILGECEVFYPAFGNLLTHDLPPEDALQMGLVDTVGEA